MSRTYSHTYGWQTTHHKGKKIKYNRARDKRGKDVLMLSSAGDTIEMLAPIPYSLDSRHIIPGCWLSWPIDYDIPASAYANIPITTK